MNEELLKRIKSFTWRLVVVMVVAGVNFIVENIAGLGFPIWAVGIVGLIGGEITKFLNKQHQAKVVIN